MPEDPVITVTVSILDKEYQIKCRPDEEHNLRQSAQRVHDSMVAVRDKSSIALGPDRVAVMAALNIASELIKEEQLADELKTGTRLELDSLSAKVDRALTRFRASTLRAQEDDESDRQGEPDKRQN